MVDERNLAAFRARMEAYRASREVERQSQAALLDLILWYGRLSAADREVANHVVAEWVLSTNETDRLDARALVHEFTITGARSSLLELKEQLENAQDVHRIYELAAVNRVLDALARKEIRKFSD